MSHDKPFVRNYRAIKPGPNSGYSDWAYIVDEQYAIAREHYTRAFKIIQNDLVKLFEYVEPSDINSDTYSYRTHELLMRSCIEIEANFKAILRENIYNPVDKHGKQRREKSWNIIDYKRINTTHRLSSYNVYIPIWNGSRSMLTPFGEWNSRETLGWYQAYNRSKHDRHQDFYHANFINVVNAVAGLLVVLSSQFRTEAFTPGSSATLGVNVDSYYKTQPALGDFFHIGFPSDWPEEEQYDFDWAILKNESERFRKINYDAISR